MPRSTATPAITGTAILATVHTRPEAEPRIRARRSAARQERSRRQPSRRPPAMFALTAGPSPSVFSSVVVDLGTWARLPEGLAPPTSQSTGLAGRRPVAASPAGRSPCHPPSGRQYHPSGVETLLHWPHGTRRGRPPRTRS